MKSDEKLVVQVGKNETLALMRKPSSLSCFIRNHPYFPAAAAVPADAPRSFSRLP